MKLANVNNALGKLKGYDECISTSLIDFKDVEFEGDGAFGTIVTGGDRIALTSASVTSISKLLKLSSSYIRDASPTLVSKSFKEFSSQLLESTANAIIYKDPSDGRLTLRGVSENGATYVPNATMLESMVTEFGNDVAVEHAPWDISNHPGHFRTRLVWPETQMDIDGNEVYIGIDLLNSDIGHMKEQINMLLYRQVCTNGAIATYGGKPYFQLDKKTSSIFSYAPVMESVARQLNTDSGTMYDFVRESQETNMDKMTAIAAVNDLLDRKKLPKGFAVKTITSIEEAGKFDTRWDFVNAVTAQARNYKDHARLKFETVGGNILGMNFGAAKHEN